MTHQKSILVSHLILPHLWKVPTHHTCRRPNSGERIHQVHFVLSLQQRSNFQWMLEQSWSYGMEFKIRDQQFFFFFIKVLLLYFLDLLSCTFNRSRNIRIVCIQVIHDTNYTAIESVSKVSCPHYSSSSIKTTCNKNFLIRFNLAECYFFYQRPSFSVEKKLNYK